MSETPKTGFVAMRPIYTVQSLKTATEQKRHFPDIFPNFRGKKGMIYHENQTILMKYHALFVIFERAAKFKLLSAANYRWRFMGQGTRIFRYWACPAGKVTLKFSLILQTHALVLLKCMQ